MNQEPSAFLGLHRKVPAIVYVYDSTLRKTVPLVTSLIRFYGKDDVDLLYENFPNYNIGGDSSSSDSSDWDEEEDDIPLGSRRVSFALEEESPSRRRRT